MGKYSALQGDVFSVFGAVAWKNEAIPTVPSNFVATDIGTTYIRVSIVANHVGSMHPLGSVSGQLLIDIFTPAGFGPSATNLIADKLDEYLVGKLIKTTDMGQSQFASSTLAMLGSDAANPSLHRSLYTIPFNHFGN